MVQVPMTQAQFKAKAAELREKEGVTLEGLGGTLSKNGVTAQWSYDGAVLKVAVTKKPFLVTTGYCEAQILDWLDSSPADAPDAGAVG